MAFIFDTNQPVTDGFGAIYRLKELLKLAGWTVTASGGGTTYPNYATSDIFTGYRTGAEAPNLLGNANSWFQIRSPSNVSLSFQTDGASYNWSINVSPSVGFTGGSTAVPGTAADQTALLNLGQLFNGGTWYWNCAADNAAPYGFWGAAINPGAVNAGEGGLVFEPLTATTPGDPYPFVFYMAKVGFQFGVSVNQGGLPSYYFYQLAWEPSLTPSNPTWVAGHCWSSNAGTLLQASSVNPLTGADEVYPIAYARRYDAGAPWQGWKGISTMMKWVSVSRSYGSTLTVSSTRDRIVLNQVSLPWDGSVPIF